MKRVPFIFYCTAMIFIGTFAMDTPEHVSASVYNQIGDAMHELVGTTAQLATFEPIVRNSFSIQNDCRLTKSAFASLEMRSEKEVNPGYQELRKL